MSYHCSWDKFKYNFISSSILFIVFFESLFAIILSSPFGECCCRSPTSKRPAKPLHDLIPTSHCIDTPGPNVSGPNAIRQIHTYSASPRLCQSTRARIGPVVCGRLVRQSRRPDQRLQEEREQRISEVLSLASRMISAAASLVPRV
jgi:hypothetical protein